MTRVHLALLVLTVSLIPVPFRSVAAEIDESRAACLEQYQAFYERLMTQPFRMELIIERFELNAPVSVDAVTGEPRDVGDRMSTLDVRGDRFDRVSFVERSILAHGSMIESHARMKFHESVVTHIHTYYDNTRYFKLTSYDAESVAPVQPTVEHCACSQAERLRGYAPFDVRVDLFYPALSEIGGERPPDIGIAEVYGLSHSAFSSTALVLYEGRFIEHGKLIFDPSDCHLIMYSNSHGPRRITYKWADAPSGPIPVEITVEEGDLSADPKGHYRQKRYMVQSLQWLESADSLHQTAEEWYRDVAAPRIAESKDVDVAERDRAGRRLKGKVHPPAEVHAVLFGD